MLMTATLAELLRESVAPDGERWRDVAGTYGRYRVSDRGRLVDLQRCTLVTNCNRVYVARRGRRGIAVGILVLEAFVGPRPEGTECCHYDDNPCNNCLNNLRWDTHAANTADRSRNGNCCVPCQRGERNSQAKLLDADVKVASKLRAAGYTYAAIGKLLGVGRNAVRDAIRRDL